MRRAHGAERHADLGAFGPPGRSEGATVKLHWTSDWNMIGNGFGYSTHQRMLKAHLEKAGVVMSEDGQIAVHIVVPTGFEPIPGKINVLYTMYECTTLPKPWIAPLQKADLIVVPCTHNKRLFEQYTKVPVEVCLEGVDIERYAFYPRSFPKDMPFMFFWNGASNPRKGYEHLIVAWDHFIRKYPKEHAKCMLYMKTTQVKNPERRILETQSHSVVDTKVYSVEDLVTLYNAAHCFVFPSMGEGFGLTLAEAMSTGLPCIYTPWSGPNDFISEREGYPVKFKMHVIKTLETTPEGVQRPYHETYAASADAAHVARRMAQVFSDYDEALRRGRAASERIRREITWDISARSFIRVLEKFMDSRRVAA